MSFQAVTGRETVPGIRRQPIMGQIRGFVRPYQSSISATHASIGRTDASLCHQALIDFERLLCHTRITKIDFQTVFTVQAIMQAQKPIVQE